MSLPFRRRSRPRGAARLALAGDFPDTGEAVTDILDRVRPADYDGTTVTFGGASDAGLPDTAPLAYHLAAMPGYEDADIPEPAARLRAQPRYRPPQPPPPAGYSATTGPMPALDRPAVSIGDALSHDETWGPKLAPVPCGYCGTPPDVPGGIDERTKILGLVNWLAAQAGWRYDTDFIWTCPPCQQDKAWKARQGTMEVSWQPCERHDGTEDPWQEIRPAGDPRGRCECPIVIKPAAPGRPGVRDCTCPPCTCPGAVAGVDVMLTSHDYLRTGRAISIQILKDTQAGAR